MLPPPEGKGSYHIIIIIIIIIIIDCKWAITRWQWLLCMYINMK